jgi:Transcriptional regulatory protein, C terminal
MTTLTPSMTTSTPSMTTSTLSMTTSTPSMTGPRLVTQDLPYEEPGRTTPGNDTALVGYLVLLPPDVDPAALFAGTGLRPQIHTVAPDPADGNREDGPVRVDTQRHVAELDGVELDLTYLEFALLARLVTHPHRVHTREQLVEHVWGQAHVGDGRTVDVHVARLRRKLGAPHRQRIVTVRRVGYKYVPASTDR